MLKLVCAAHSPLIGHLDPEPEISAATQRVLDEVAQEIRDYDPELVVVFGPDHFVGFLYELMPPFCIGVRADAVGDFGISRAGVSYRVPEATALALAQSLQEADIDTAVSYRMRADHGFAQSLEQVAGGVGRYPTIPFFINCAAPPLPSMARVRRVGAAVGAFLAGLNQRVLVIGSGGLSHDPPIPRIGQAPPEVEELLIAGRDTSPERMQAKLKRNLDVAAAMARGTGSARPLNREWDLWFAQRLIEGNLDAVQALSTEAIGRDGGVGAQEVRTWVAAFSALAAAGPYTAALRHYEAVPEWNAGYGIVTACTQVEVTA